MTERLSNLEIKIASIEDPRTRSFVRVGVTSAFLRQVSGHYSFATNEPLIALASVFESMFAERELFRALINQVGDSYRDVDAVDTIAVALKPEVYEDGFVALGMKAGAWTELNEFINRETFEHILREVYKNREFIQLVLDVEDVASLAWWDDEEFTGAKTDVALQPLSLRQKLGKLLLKFTRS